MTLHQTEIAVLRAALNLYKGNRTITAERLGISVRKLRNDIQWCRMMGIQIREPETGQRSNLEANYG
jgi:DNA-binding NtrC family response regulator